MADSSFISAITPSRRLSISCRSLADSARPLADSSFISAITPSRRLSISCRPLADSSFISAIIPSRRLSISCRSLADSSFISAITPSRRLSISCRSLTDSALISAITPSRRLSISCRSLADSSFISAIIFSIRSIKRSWRRIEIPVWVMNCPNSVSNRSVLSSTTSIRSASIVIASPLYLWKHLLRNPMVIRHYMLLLLCTIDYN